MYRTFDVVFWPVFELILWGFVSLWVQSIASPDLKTQILYSLLTALLFWDLFNRAQQGFSVAFLEERWSHNLVNIFVAPVTLREFLAGLVAVSVIKSVLALSLLIVLSWALYALDIFKLGFFFVPFLLNIFLFGLTLGIVAVSLVIRFGSSVEIMVWALSALLQPVSAVFYPVSVLPSFLQKIVFLLPTTHMFEGMREVLRAQILPVDSVGAAFVLNIVYLAMALLFFRHMFLLARKKGLLLRLSTE